jgi:3-oxoacyl-[acyl-carrier-protein] synthase II
VVTALGNNLQRTWENLAAGRGAIHPRPWLSGPWGEARGAAIPLFEPPAGGSRLESLLDGVLAMIPATPPDAALVTATTKGGGDLLTRRENGGDGMRDALLPEALPRLVARRRGLRPGINVSAACASSTLAIARAAGRIASGRAEAALVVCLDLLTPFVLAGFSALKALAAGPCRPFDRERCGLALGEGAAALLLMSPRRARREGRCCRGAVLGWGSAGDANHLTAPLRDGGGLVRAVEQALRGAAQPIDAVAGISAHGTGTRYNDAMELAAFQRLFGSRFLPVGSVKGAIGHTLGAAGGIEAVLGLKALWESTLPPTRGCRHPEGWAEGRVASRPLPLEGEILLSTNSGFGGINAALLLARGACGP